MVYTHLLLDLDNTLFDFSACEEAALKIFFNALCGAVKEDYIAVYHHCNAACWKRVERGDLSVNEVNKLRVAMTVKMLLKQGVKLKIDAAEAERILIDGLSKYAILFEGACSLVQALSKRYILVAITNGIDKVKQIHLKTSGLMPYFQHVFTSEAVGYSKPDRRFFDAVFTKVNVATSNCLVIGDGLGSDIEGANVYGIDACWFNPKEIAPKVRTFQFEVKNYHELKALLLNE